MWAKLGTAIASLIIDKIIGVVMAWIKEETEKRKTRKEIDKKVKELREAKTHEEIRDSIRNLNL